MDKYRVLTIILQAGAIGLAFSALWFCWRSWRTGQNITENRLRLIKAMMLFSLAVILLGILTEGVRSYFDTEAREKSARKVFTDMFLGQIFEPQISNTGGYEYIDRAPSGLFREVQTDPVFQEFSTMHLVQRLWYDPRFPNSFIQASQQTGPPASLLVKFVRSEGWGCDVTIKGKNNRVVLTDKHSKLVIWMQLDRETCKVIKNHKLLPIGFRVRVVDGRTNHWSWGEPKMHTGVESADYSVKDGSGKLMVVTSDVSERFEFAIGSRENWALFRSDGSVAPVQQSGKPFRFIQFVVLEFGFQSKNILASKKTDDPYAHERHLTASPVLPDGSQFVASVVVNKIQFE